MKKSDRLKRAIAFYSSVALFFILLPILLSYSLGYQVDFHALRIYKTGILYINSHPTGASMYINGKRYPDLTPVRVEKLKPGSYKIEVKREGFYSWEKDLVVRPNMVTKADAIVLFPIAKEMRRINDYEISDFAISDKNYIYYMARTGLFRSNMDGSNLKKISTYSNWPEKIINKRFSSGGDKFLYFNEKDVGVVYLNLDKTSPASYGENVQVEELLISEDPIVDAFWYSGGGYIIVVTEKYVDVMELRSGAGRNIVSLYKFNTKPRSVYYDLTNDSLYFTDTEKGPGTNAGLHLYKLDLRQNFFDNLMRLLLKKEVPVPDEKR